jgi:hypothetical protein
MPAIFKRIINISVWVLFIKGLLDGVVGAYAACRSVITGRGNPMVGLAATAVRAAALILACVAAWLRKKLERHGHSTFHQQTYISEGMACPKIIVGTIRSTAKSSSQISQLQHPKYSI